MIGPSLDCSVIGPSQGSSFKGSSRSSRPEVFCKTGVLRNLAKFATKNFFARASFLILKQRLWHRCFPVNFAKFLRTPFFTEHLWWLLLVLFESSVISFSSEESSQLTINLTCFHNFNKAVSEKNE